MALARKLTPIEVIDALIRRLERMIDALKRVGLEGFRPVLVELAVEISYLNRARLKGPDGG